MTRAPANRQVLAQAWPCDIMPFAPARPLPDAGSTSIAAHSAACDLCGATPCKSFPLNWPSPFGTGPFFCKKGGAEISSQRGKNPVESASITTNFRGKSCGNLLCLAFWPCHFQLVWTMTSSAALWARAWVRRLPRPRGAISIRAQCWAACSARCATTLTSAVGATKSPSAFGPFLNIRPNGQPARLAFFAFAPSALARLWQRQELAHV